MDDCWNHIGVSGDRSCPELVSVIHCRNCAVYARAGRSLLERCPPDDYLADWTTVLAEQPARLSSDERVVAGNQSLAVMVFRLGGELFALPLRLLQEVTPPCGIHSVPGRSNGCFLGLVNIRGEILLALSLRQLLGIGPEPSSGADRCGLPEAGMRMAVTTAGDEQCVITIDEVLGIHLCASDDLQPPPVVHSAAGGALLQALLPWKGRQVALLDGERLLRALYDQVQQR